MSVDPYTTLAATLVDSENSATASEALASMKAWLNELSPGIDTEGLVVNTLLLYPLATRQAAADQLIQIMRDYSLLSPLPVDTIADDTLREELRTLQAKEYGITAVAGRLASGVLQLTFGSGESKIIAEGSQFSSAGGIAITTAPYILRANETSADPRIQHLTPVGDTWVAYVPVVMTEVGAAGNVAANTAFTTNLQFADLQSIFAAGGFVGGQDPHDAGTMVADFLDSRVLPTMGSRDQLVSLLRSRDDLGDIREISVIGFGDLEMHRDKTRLVPGGGSRTDVYIAASNYPTTTTVSLTAVPVSRPDSGGQLYTIAIGRDIAPGFLDVLSVVDATTGQALTIQNVIRGIEVTPIPGEQVPRVVMTSQATFSRYQTATVYVEDTPQLSNPSATSRTVQVSLWYQPGIAAVQSLVSQRQTRYPAGDTLVRGAIPLSLSIVVRMRSSSGEDIPEAEQLRQAVLSEISRKPLRTALYDSDIVIAMAPFLRATLSVASVDFYATYIHPDGRKISINSSGALYLPNLPDEQVTPRTVAIYASAASINFEVGHFLGLEIP